LVNFFLGPAAAGVYVIAVQLGERLWMLSQSVSTVILPRLAELSNEEGKRQQLTPLITRWVLWITFSFAILFGVISYPLIALLFGKEFLSGVLPLLLLLPGITVMAPARVLANDIAARGRPGLNAYSSCAALLVNIAGNLMLIPTYGLAGAAVATSAAYIVIFSLCLWMHYRFTGLPVWHNLAISRRDVEMIRAYLCSRP
jgi:O-antigen/teichoic acid export membrane protein